MRYILVFYTNGKQYGRIISSSAIFMVGVGAKRV